MCYHVSTKVKRALKSEHKDGFRIVEESEKYSGYEIPDLPSTLQMGQADFTPLKWGLIPQKTESFDEAMRLQEFGRIAKAETMFTKYMFWYAATHCRCLIWLDGFYENQHVGKGKKTIPYFIHMPGNELFAVGGLYSRWRNPVDGEVFETCAIVTTKANELMAEIHNSPKNGNRMPLILPDNKRNIWLNHGISAQEIYMIAEPFMDGILEAQKITEISKNRPLQESLF